MPNLASRSLELALKALPEHMESQHGYRPLMAETFTSSRTPATKLQTRSCWDLPSALNATARITSKRMAARRSFGLKASIEMSCAY
jgi:hypothetical protein